MIRRERKKEKKRGDRMRIIVCPYNSLPPLFFKMQVLFSWANIISPSTSSASTSLCVGVWRVFWAVNVLVSVTVLCLAFVVVLMVESGEQEGSGESVLNVMAWTGGLGTLGIAMGLGR